MIRNKTLLKVAFKIRLQEDVTENTAKYLKCLQKA